MIDNVIFHLELAKKILQDMKLSERIQLEAGERIDFAIKQAYRINNRMKRKPRNKNANP
jgi:hypothetical protein